MGNSLRVQIMLEQWAVSKEQVYLPMQHSLDCAGKVGAPRGRATG
jgi:hypothetical protein